jgi:hypothetical protein
MVQFFQITIPLIWTNIRTTLTSFIISTITMAFLFVKAVTSGGPMGLLKWLELYVWQKMRFIGYVCP